jgi:AcrR family transcriptional regulator
MPPADRRTLILAAAGKLFVDRGYEATTMDEIRRAVDVSNGSLFHHFPTKDSLASALYIEALRSYQAAVLVEFDGHKSPRRAICAAVEAHLRWVAHHVDEARRLHERRADPSVEAARKEISAMNAVDKHVKAGSVRNLPLDVFSAIVIGPAMEFTRAWLRKPDPQRMARVTRPLSEAAWRAICAKENRT